MVRLTAVVLGLSLLAFITGCAIVVPPVGGPKDTEPPRLDSIRSTPNFQTNFAKQRIELVFNEWLVLEEAAKQVVVSPPLRYNAELVKLKGKSILVDFDPREELRPNVTYTINFGSSIKDLTERNPVKNLRFVFSTGPVLDSLGISGKVVDAITAKPLENIVVLFYDNLADSVVRRERPLYFDRTDEAGNFAIDNMRGGQFKAFALEDANLNYLFDGANEKIAFPDQPVTVGAAPDSSLVLKLFAETPPLRLASPAQPHYGLIKLPFNQPPVAVVAQSNLPDLLLRAIPQRDTLQVWYHRTAPIAAAWNLVLRQDSIWQDTITVKPQTVGDYLAKNPLQRLLPTAAGRNALPQNPDRPLNLVFNQPLQVVDASRIRLLEDSLKVVPLGPVRIDSAQAQTLIIQPNWKEEKQYRLQLLPGALTDLFGRPLPDTVQLNIQALPRKNFGNLDFRISKLDSTAHYVVELYGSSGNLAYRFAFSGKRSHQQVLRTVEPSAYKLRFFQDRNRNGRWDSGNYDRKQQPEPIFTRDLEPVRPNWDQELTLEGPQ